MPENLRPAPELRQLLREGAYAQVRDEVRAHPGASLEHQKCLCDALAQLRDWKGAIAQAEAYLGQDSYFRPMLLAKLTQNARDFPACWRWLETVREAEGETLDWLITANKAANAEGDVSRAVAYGQRVLDEKDRVLGTPVPARRMEGGTRKVLSFSLFGQREVYLLGALACARLWARALPDWTCRFYLAPDVPQGIAQALGQLGAEVGRVRDARIPPYMARFLPLQDPGVAQFACRDVDCRPTPREVEILREWETSGRAFHVLRNHPLHTDLVLAGLWGGVPLQGFDLAAEIAACFPLGTSNKYGLDQRFLEQSLWARIRGDLLSHDQHYRIGDLETRKVEDSGLGLGHQDARAVRAELEGLGIRIGRPGAG